jgi:hypothetical protein
MELHQKKAISAIAVVFIILAAIAVILGILFVESFTFGTYCCNVRGIEMESVTFNATTSTLNFTLNNPMSETTISSVIVNQMSCNNANFALLKADTATSESCIVSGATFRNGETVNYTTSFANGQTISGSVYAQ